MLHRATRGLAIPIDGEPAAEIDRARTVSHVALLGDDYIGMRPTLHAAVGDSVRRGQLLFEDKKTPGVRFTAPAAGRVAAINRGERRAFQSLVIELSSEEREGRGAQAAFASYTGRHPSALSRQAVRDLLLESGLWTALRARPFSRVADPAETPRSVFVTAIDTDPLAPPVAPIVRGREDDFDAGLAALGQLHDGPVFVCTPERFDAPIPAGERVRHERFAGPHPAGTVGFHIHTLDPAGRGRLVWHAGCQDVLAIGRLFRTGTLDSTRVIALGGPAALRPRLLQTRIGASLDELLDGELDAGEVRVVSGSVLSGRAASGTVRGYLGRHHRQVSVLPEGRRREFMGWAAPGVREFSALPIFLSRLLPRQRFRMTTSTHGSPRAIVPIGLYEKVMPYDVEPTFLLKALVSRDLERAEQLGCLELDEEDLALCTFVCPGKHDYGSELRAVLSSIEEGG
ncbi:MAG: Na(+)-translocating NADH-quinone reductase subunit A [Acidimicrobiia bacterium]|nr:Na(+)-translocating NADH-quinone reductase subunit A [Acidimicrobiia bacterium]